MRQAGEIIEGEQVAVVGGDHQLALFARERPHRGGIGVLGSAGAHETFSPLRQFAWQSGYGAFTVSVSHVAATISYIQNQVEHHRLRSFQEEYVSFLKKHGIGFEERYLWD